MFTDIRQLKTSLDLLTAALKVVASPRKVSQVDPVMLSVFRGSLAQHFEWTYTHCWRMLHNYFVEELPTDPSAPHAIEKLFKRAEQSGLLESAIAWKGFHDARNASVMAGAASQEKEISEPLMRAILDFGVAARKFHLIVDMKSRHIGAATIFSRERDDARKASFLPRANADAAPVSQFIFGDLAKAAKVA